MEKICLNEYQSKSERKIKVESTSTPKSVLTYDTHVAQLAQIELLNIKFDESNLNQANVSQTQFLKYDLCGGGHANGMCVPKGISEEVRFANFQKNNPYSNTYNPNWKYRPNFKRNNNETSDANQGTQQAQQMPFQRKPWPLEETLNKFFEMTQNSLEQLNKQNEIMNKSHEASSKNLEMQTRQLSHHVASILLWWRIFEQHS